MRLQIIVAWVLLIFVSLVAQASAADERVTLQLDVTVPAATPSDARVYLSGNQPAAGSWRADGLALQKQADGHWHTKLEVSKGTELQFKFNLGTWAGVEKGKAGEEIANRSIKADSDRTVELAILSWATTKPATGQSPARQHTLTGDFKTHKAFESKYLSARRDVIVFLPPGYGDAANAGSRYPVLYMHDGQNLFDAATSFGGVEWGLDETATKLIEQGKIVPIIIVGICNTSARMTEYTYGADSEPKGKSGEQYLQFVAEELKPFIDQTYRTKPDRKNTAVGGSSLGGLISLYMASTRPDVFSMAAVISPSLFWDNSRAIKEVPSHAPYPKDVKFWVDIGTHEGRPAADGGPNAAVLNCRQLIAAFDKAGLTRDVNYRYEEIEGAAHNEAAWSARIDRTLLYFFCK